MVSGVAKVIEEEEVGEEQIMLTFDMPLSAAEKEAIEEPESTEKVVFEFDDKEEVKDCDSK